MAPFISARYHYPEGPDLALSHAARRRADPTLDTAAPYTGERGGMSVESLVGLISGSGGALGTLAIFMALLLAGKLHTDDEFQREVKRGDVKDKVIAEKERALQLASERADTAVESSKMIAEAFTSASQRRSRGTKAP